MTDQSTFQFSCPNCSALLQAVLKQALTSVQCGECLDVFDVQMPAAPPVVQAVAPPVQAFDDHLTELRESQNVHV